MAFSRLIDPHTSSPSAIPLKYSHIGHLRSRLCATGMPFKGEHRCGGPAFVNCKLTSTSQYPSRLCQLRQLQVARTRVVAYKRICSLVRLFDLGAVDRPFTLGLPSRSRACTSNRCRENAIGNGIRRRPTTLLDAMIQLRTYILLLLPGILVACDRHATQVSTTDAHMGDPESRQVFAHVIVGSGLADGLC